MKPSRSGLEDNVPRPTPHETRAEPGQLWEFPLDGGGLLGWLVAGSQAAPDAESAHERGAELGWLMVPVDSEPELGPGDRAVPLFGESEALVAERVALRWAGARWVRETDLWFAVPRLVLARAFVGQLAQDFGVNSMNVQPVPTAQAGVWQQAARDLDRWLARRVVDAELREIVDWTAHKAFGADDALDDSGPTAPFERPLAAASHDWLGDLVAKEPAQPARRFALGGGLNALELECDPLGFCLRGPERPQRLVCLGANGGRRFVSWMPQLTGGWRSAWIERTSDTVRLLIEQRAEVWDVRFELPS